MELGDIVIWQGRKLIVRGFDPMSVPDASAQLEDEQSGEMFVVPVAELEEPSVSGPEP